MSNDKKRDDGKYRDDAETCSGYNRYDVTSLMVKLARRGPHSEEDREKMLWCAWELSRSGFHYVVFDRCHKLALEDCRLSIDEADLLLVLERLEHLATERFDPTEGFGLACAMRAASLLYEATPSHELLTIKNVWKKIAERGDDISEIQEEFPVPTEQENWGEMEHTVLDMHTRAKGWGRNGAHHAIYSARTRKMTELERRYRRRNMELLSYEFDDEQIEVATTPVAEQDDPWDDPNVGFPRH
jgi:hypothetical protein